jgi:hypothetical protein
MNIRQQEAVSAISFKTLYIYRRLFAYKILLLTDIYKAIEVS